LTKRSLKRKKCEDDSDEENIDSIIQRTEKQLANRKAEIQIKPGDDFVPGFTDLHYVLCYNNSYMPLSLFTNDNLTVINREASSLPKVSINPHGLKGKKVYLLDIEKFEAKYGAEANLSQNEWVEAAANFVSFLETLGNPGQSQALRWKNHFGFFESRRNASKIFPAIRSLDIRFRKDYTATPFMFDAALYDLELQKTLNQLRFDQLEEQLSGGKGGSSSAPSQNKPRTFARQTNNAPFQRRAVSDPSSAVCVICARRGHMFNSCNSSTFDDGSPVISRADGSSIVTIKGKSQLCRSWNIRGSSSSACSNHSQDKRLHLCSFCGEKSHHAFSWTC